MVNSRIKSLVTRTLSRFKRLSIPKQFQLFDGICRETFNCGVYHSTKRTSVDDATNKHYNVPSLSILTDHAMTHLITAKDGNTTTDVLPTEGARSTNIINLPETTERKTPEKKQIV